MTFLEKKFIKECFNPLSIGAFISTLLYMQNKQQANRDVSIPYQSGRSFPQAIPPPATPFVQQCFNPLSIGAFISTLLYMQNKQQANRDVSIPYQSGRSFPPTMTFLEKKFIKECFNPLSIGAFISTRGTNEYL